MKRFAIAAVAAGFMSLGLMLPAAAMPLHTGLVNAAAAAGDSNLTEVRGYRHAMRRGARGGYHRGYAPRRHRGWR